MICPSCGKEIARQARYCSDCGGRLSSDTGRRQVTVMFCDIVSSTAMAEGMDPEDFDSILLAYQQCCMRIIARNQGYMPRFLGDGILVYFGLPSAREDDPRRAIQTALEITECVPALAHRLQQEYGTGLAVRIGIHTGLVVVGRCASEWMGDDPGAVGSTLNIGARLQELAPPNGVVISQDTYQLVRGLFIVEALGPQRLKGVSREIHVFRVIESSSAKSSFEARAAAGLSPLLGRDRQLARLIHEWSLARQGSMRSVLITGEPGIGKSRLIHELQNHTEQDFAIRIVCNSAQQYQNSAFYPIATELTRLLAICRQEDRKSGAKEVKAAIGQFGLMDSESGLRIAALLTGRDEEQPVAKAPTNEAKQQIIEALTSLITALSTRAPLLLVFEDLHWADPSSVELLTYICSSSRLPRVLVVASFRPDFSFEVAGATKMRLERIGNAECLSLIKAVSDGRIQSPLTLNELVERSNGVPLYAEELTKSVMDTLYLDNDPRGTRSIVPASLQDSLMARLDRLGPGKEIAQVAAAIGRNFSLDLLYGVWDGVASKLRAGINSLLNAELIFQQTPNSCADPANTIFEFIHELVRETAYQSLLRSRRREIHRRIAQILEKRFPNEVARHPELLAHHLSEAGLPQQALPLWRLAAHNAVRNSANLEAIGHLSRALEIVRTQSLTPATKAQELELQMSLATPLMAAKGYGSPELDAVIRRAMALVEEIGNVPQIFPLLYGRWSFYQVTGELRNALELAQDFVNLAERQTDTGPVIVGQRLLGTSFQALGHPKLSLVHVERALAVFDADRHSSLAYSYGADIKVMALCTLALTKWTLGMEASARSRMHEAWQRAESLGHANTLAYCSSYRATLGYLCGEVEVVESASEFSTFLSAEHSLPLWQVTAKGFQGWTQLSRGDPAGAARMLRETLTSMQQIKLIYWQATVWMWFGQALDGAGHFDDAEAAFVHSHEIMEHTGERWAEAELFRAWGCARLHAGRTDAESLFQTSLNIAQEQNAIAWSLRTTLEMAQQASCAGDDVHARDLLRPILATLPDSEGGADFARARLIMNGARSSRNWHVITKHESASL